MNRCFQYWIRCALSISLFFFAATADFIATSVITIKHNANNPVVHIEHKCAGHGGKVTEPQQKCSAAEHGIALQSTDRRLSIDQPLRQISTASKLDSVLLLPVPSTPLRC